MCRKGYRYFKCGGGGVVVKFCEGLFDCCAEVFYYVTGGCGVVVGSVGVGGGGGGGFFVLLVGMSGCGTEH